MLGGIVCFEFTEGISTRDGVGDLKSNLARGIITHQDQHNFRNFILKHSKVADLNQSDILQWMNLALSCWMSSIYHNLWKHRNREQFD